MDETIHLVQMPEEVVKLIYPDVAITRGRGRKRRSSSRNGAGEAVLEPVVIPHEVVEEVRQTRMQGDYVALVSRADGCRNCEVYHWFVREPLPTLPIPLKAPDADVHVALQAVFRQTYERGRYGRSLNYRQAPPAPLAAAGDRRWAMDKARKK